MKKRIFTLLMALFIVCTPAQVNGHSGRTDGNGGHRDNKNKSGLGYYHYHCGGYPAHLHTNGVCPYSDGGSQKSTVNNSRKSSSTVAKVNTSLKAQVPNFSVCINGTEINTGTSEYPPLVFNDVTYVPLTSDILIYLNLSYQWDDPAHLIFNRASEEAGIMSTFCPEFQNGTCVRGNHCNIVKVDKGIMINGTQISNQYPIINSKNINYLPLTTEIISGLGLSGGWNQSTGFELTVK
jgi:hypothetical protein